MFKITTVEFTGDPKDALKEVLKGMDEEMRIWTMRAARGECAWICADCCGTENSGMPDECFHGLQSCTDIIQRDKKLARAQ